MRRVAEARGTSRARWIGASTGGLDDPLATDVGQQRPERLGEGAVRQVAVAQRDRAAAKTPKPSPRAVEVASVTRRVFPTPASPEMRTVDGAARCAVARGAKPVELDEATGEGRTHDAVDIAGIIDPASTGATEQRSRGSRRPPGAVSVARELGRETTERERFRLLWRWSVTTASSIVGRRRRIRPPVKCTPFVVGVPPGFVTRQGAQRQQSSKSVHGFVPRSVWRSSRLSRSG